jgi:hypothetical protein
MRYLHRRYLEYFQYFHRGRGVANESGRGPRLEALEKRTFFSASVLDHLDSTTRDLVDWNVPAVQALPADPQGTLIRDVAAFSSLLGVEVHPEAAVRAAQLPDDIAGRLALVVEAMSNSHQISALARQSIPSDQWQDLLTGKGPSLDSLWRNRIAGAAKALEQAETGVEQALRPYQSTGRALGNLDIWPVLRFEGGTGNTRYVNDYALQVDMGGNDVYANNAGGNVIDVHFGPQGSAAPEKGPARGAQVLGDATTGNNVISAALLLDMGGNDIYGVMQTPDVDAHCTSDLLIRRILTEGAGLVGVGIVRDLSGNDVYTGKTLSQGTGHVGGVGILSDLSGRDSYKAIRNAQGFALVGGIGILRDQGNDNDRFDYYMPRGGIIDDVGDCDDIPRFVQGGGNVGGTGVFINEGGNDYYRAPTPAQAGVVNPPLPTSGLPGQGSGTNGGIGIFLDLGGWDRYVDGPGRINNTLVGPSLDNPGGFFEDRS